MNIIKEFGLEPFVCERKMLTGEFFGGIKLVNNDTNSPLMSTTDLSFRG